MFNDLIEELDSNGFKIYAYADDLAVLSQSRVELSKAIKIIENWTERNKMTINKKKSGVIFFKRRSNKNQEQEF